MARVFSMSVEQTMDLGRALAGVLEADDVVLLEGGLGAGKTQFCKGVAAGLGISEEVTSPTFGILVEYPDGRLPLFHLDLYRLEHACELEDIDYYGVLEGGGACLVEWGDKFPEALPDEYLELSIEARGDGARILTFTGHGPRGLELEQAYEGQVG